MKDLIVGAFVSAVVSLPMWPTDTEHYVAPKTIEIQSKEVTIEKRPEIIHKNPGTEIQGKVTMYNSVPEQTDDTPFHTADGSYVRRGIVANNCLPFKTKVVINNEVFEVRDRMNARYGCEHFDIWSESIQEARQYGLQKHTVLVFSVAKSDN